MSDVPACFKTFVGCATQCAQEVPEQLIDGAIAEFHQTFPEVNSFADCIKAEKDCMTASTGLQKIKCLVDLATCVGGETAKCAQKCGPPLVTCVKSAIFGGKVSDVPACFLTFIGCAKECAKAGAPVDSLVDDAISHFHTSFPEVESFADCIKAEKDCMTAATGLQKIKCLVDLATCVGGETAKCAQKCGP